MKQLTKDKAEKLKPGAIVFLKVVPQKKANLIELGPDVEHFYVPCKVTGLTSKKWVRAAVDLRNHAYYDLDLHKVGVLGVDQTFAPALLKQPSENLPVYYYLRSTAASTATPMLPDSAEEAEAVTKKWEAFLAAKDKAQEEHERKMAEWEKDQDREREIKFAKAVKANEDYVQAVYALHGEPNQFADWQIHANGKTVHVHTSIKREAKGWKVDSVAYYWQGFRVITVSKKHPPKKTWQEAIAEVLVHLAYRLWDVLEEEKE